jgi:hypothetical protein
VQAIVWDYCSIAEQIPANLVARPLAEGGCKRVKA